MHACQLELITGVCRDVAQAIGQLEALAAAVTGTGAGLVGAGTHPTAEEGDAEITDRKRYRLISGLLGDALATPVAALHVHVGMPDPETAIRAFNGLRRHLPLLEALAANSPFRHGRDTGLASAREITLRGWARSGAPRAFRDFDDFTESTATLTAVAEVPDYTFHWWKMRPHPRLGTVEIRALDVQGRPEHTAALVAAVHCLARHEAEAEPTPGPAPAILDEASFKAGRAGVTAHLPDAGLTLRPVAELLEDMLALARPHARELGCSEELENLTALAELGGGAGSAAHRGRRRRHGRRAGGGRARAHGLTGTLDAWPTSPRLRRLSSIELIEPHRRELLAHCYRMLGSLHDAEDAMQDALLRAWRGIEDFDGRSSPRTWLYRIATNASLDVIAGRKKAPVLPADHGPPVERWEDPPADGVGVVAGAAARRRATSGARAWSWRSWPRCSTCRPTSAPR